MKLPTLKKDNKLFWLYIVFGVLLIIVSVFLAPVWGKLDVFWKDWGSIILNLIIAFFLSLYLFGFLLKRMLKTRGQTLKVLIIIEFTILFLIDLFLILGQWIPQLNIFKINGACAITGLALWVRGVVEIFRAYYHQHGNNEHYPVWWLCISIAFVSVGLWMLVKPFIDDLVILWIFVGLIFVIGVLCLAYGIWSKPKKIKK